MIPGRAKSTLRPQPWVSQHAESDFEIQSDEKRPPDVKKNYKITAVTRNVHSAGYILKTQANPGYLELVELKRFKIDKIDDSVEQNNYILIIKKDFANEIIDKLIFDIRTNENK